MGLRVRELWGYVFRELRSRIGFWGMLYTITGSPLIKYRQSSRPLYYPRSESVSRILRSMGFECKGLSRFGLGRGLERGSSRIYQDVAKGSLT